MSVDPTYGVRYHVLMSMFGWCLDGKHDNCRREFERYYWDERKKTFVTDGEIVKCQCSKRGCDCYVPAKERKKTKRK